MASHTFTMTQSGRDFGSWVEETVPTVRFALGGPIGLRFLRDGPSRKLWSNPTLTLTRTSGTGGTFTLYVYCIKRIQAAAFSDSNMPSEENFPTELLYSESVTINAANPTLEVELPMNDATTGMRTYFGSLLSDDSQASRVIGLLLSATGLAVSVIMTGTLTADYDKDIKGLPSARPMMSRADECPRCGTIGFREEWQFDGETNTLVCADCYDPPSPPRGPRTRLNEVNP